MVEAPVKYTTRVLPLEEWERLAATGMEVLQEARDAAIAGRVIVVEADGRILGTAIVTTCAYVDGLWIDPASRQNPAVGRALLEALTATIPVTGAKAALLATLQAAIGPLVERLRGHAIPGRLYILPAERTPDGK